MEKDKQLVSREKYKKTPAEKREFFYKEFTGNQLNSLYGIFVY